MKRRDCSIILYSWIHHQFNRHRIDFWWKEVERIWAFFRAKWTQTSETQINTSGGVCDLEMRSQVPIWEIDLFIVWCLSVCKTVFLGICFHLIFSFFTQWFDSFGFLLKTIKKGQLNKEMNEWTISIKDTKDNESAAREWWQWCYTMEIGVASSFVGFSFDCIKNYGERLEIFTPGWLKRREHKNVPHPHSKFISTNYCFTSFDVNAPTEKFHCVTIESVVCDTHKCIQKDVNILICHGNFSAAVSILFVISFTIVIVMINFFFFWILFAMYLLHECHAISISIIIEVVLFLIRHSNITAYILNQISSIWHFFSPNANKNKQTNDIIKPSYLHRFRLRRKKKKEKFKWMWKLFIAINILNSHFRLKCTNCMNFSKYLDFGYLKENNVFPHFWSCNSCHCYYH